MEDLIFRCCYHTVLRIKKSTVTKNAMSNRSRKNKEQRNRKERSVRWNPTLEILHRHIPTQRYWLRTYSLCRLFPTARKAENSEERKGTYSMSVQRTRTRAFLKIGWASRRSNITPTLYPFIHQPLWHSVFGFFSSDSFGYYWFVRRDLKLS